MFPRPISWRRASILCALPLLAFLVASCVTSGFKQSAAVDLELRFNGWDAMCITKPDTRENGFISMMNLGETLQAIERLNVSHGFAAVVVSYNYKESQVSNIAAEWQKLLAARGFARVVVLHGNDATPIAGLPIVFDSAISSGNDTRGFSNPYAAAPAAARTDVAHPSVTAIR